MPPPNVTSAVIRLVLRKEPPVKVEDENHFFRIIKASFSQRRKTLTNSLSSGLGKGKEEILAALEECGLGANARAEELSLEDFAALSKVL